MTHKQTSSRLSSLAARILNGYKPTDAELKSLAACVLGQDQTKGQEPEGKGWLRKRLGL